MCIRDRYTAFHGFVEVVMLQYYFQDFILFVLIRVWYLVFLQSCILYFSLSCCFCPLVSSSEDTLFLAIVSSSVHLGTDFFLSALSEACFFGNELLQAFVNAFWNFSMLPFMLVSSHSVDDIRLLTLSVVPSVSYTHLDVYKRQVFMLYFMFSDKIK